MTKLAVRVRGWACLADSRHAALAGDGGVLRRGRHPGDRPAVWIDDLLTAEARSSTAAREIPNLLDVDPAVGPTRHTVDLAPQWAARHAER